MKVQQLDPEVLGRNLLGIVPASLKGKHSWPRSTVTDYIAVETLEDEFIKDLFKLPTMELVEKWYGGQMELLTYIARNSVFLKKDPD
ncbi:hypothetical protein [Planococcus lenghuensis]|uniref:Uncharacterized protein n=1 Tax=Planococcus lenghuensis TaxID=2213202 RepID=A0A1Q2L4A2_9BACL|nr:hypothetical protein [Planococcus lenghuensis]AQQ55253.1 hypothetical protein B0X71_18905 [Planococcus lenghuensis]